MNRINDYAGLQVATPLVDAEAGKKQTNTKQLYQPGVLFQPGLQKLPVLNAPNTPAASGNLSALPLLSPGQVLAANSSAPTASPTATVTSALTPSVTTLPNIDTMPLYIQQDDSSGTTSLAEIMSYLGKPMTQADIDKVLRDASPEDMIRFARDNGLEAEEYNNSVWSQVRDQIDAGHPVQALINGDPSGTETDVTSTSGLEVSGDDLHYINITGYGTDPASGEEYITYHDPHLGTEQRMSVSNFEKMWGDLPGGYKNYFQAYAPKGSDLPAGSDSFSSADNAGLQGTQGTLNGVANVASGWNRWTGNGTELPDILHGIFQVAGGIPQTAVCFICAGLQQGTSWIHDQVGGIPVLKNVVQPLADWVGAPFAGIADVANGFGESMDDLGGAFEDLAHGDGRKALDKLGDAAKDLGSGIAHGAVDTLSEIGHGVADLFGL